MGCARAPAAVEPLSDPGAIDALGLLSSDALPSPVTDLGPVEGARFAGGDGTSDKAAIVVVEARDPKAAENALIRRAFGAVTFVAEERYGIGERRLDTVTILRAGGRRSTIWFDVTAVTGQRR